MPFDLDGPNEIHFDAKTLEGASETVGVQISSGQICFRDRKHDRFTPQMVVNSKGNPLISGKSRLVKYYHLARFHGTMQLVSKLGSTLLETNSSYPKMDGWNAIVSFWGPWPIFRGKLTVSFKEGRKLQAIDWVVLPPSNSHK